MLRFMLRFGRLLDVCYMSVSLVLLAVIIVSSTMQVFTRYIMGNAVTGTEELGRYCFIWMSMLGGSICVGKWLHPSISILTDALGPRLRVVSGVLLNLLVILVSSVLVVKGAAMVSLTMKQLSPVLRIPMSIVYLGVPLGAFGMGCHAIENIALKLSPAAPQEDAA